MSLTDEGWAIRRNGSCLRGIEVDCGVTLAPYHACCPTGYACPSQYNVACCFPGTNCTETLVAAPQPACANATWDLFDNGGYFCCDHGLPGYNNSNTNGCARPGATLPQGVQLLSTMRVGVDTATIASTRSTATSVTLPVIVLSTSATTSTVPEMTSTVASDVPSPSSSTPVGAIAGGVVGGIVALALLGVLIWFLRRKKKHESLAELDDSSQKYLGGTHTKYRYEAPEGKPTFELNSQGANSPDAELPAQQNPVELDGTPATQDAAVSRKVV